MLSYQIMETKIPGQFTVFAVINDMSRRFNLMVPRIIYVDDIKERPTSVGTRVQKVRYITIGTIDFVCTEIWTTVEEETHSLIKIENIDFYIINYYGFGVLNNLAIVSFKTLPKMRPCSYLYEYALDETQFFSRIV